MSTNAYWGITLALGLVVAVVAVVLLEVFLRRVRRIERVAGDIWVAGKLVAQNTATTWMLADTSDRLDMLVEEAVQHEALFERGGST